MDDNQVIREILERTKDPSYCSGAVRDIEYLLYLIHELTKAQSGAGEGK